MLAAQRGDQAQRGEREKDQDAQNGRIAPRPLDARALAAPEDAERAQHQADAELHGILRRPAERAVQQRAEQRHQQQRQASAKRGQRDAALVRAEREHDKRDL